VTDPQDRLDAIGAYGNPAALEQELTTVRAIYEAFARRDLDAALRFIAEDCELLAVGTAAQTGRTGPYRGHAGVREYFADAARVWDELSFHTEDIRAAAGGVVVFGLVEGRRGEQCVRRRVMWTWQVRDGAAVAMRVNDLGDARPAGS
jgi:ketosteroid isomerase-like protein